jgi:hypothetical protein
MKTITRIFAMLAVMSAVIFMDACKGEKGDVGPAGTTGAAGPTGANGAVGATGATGTANVIYSPWVAFPASTTTSAAFLYNFVTPGITQDILDKGVVLSFVRTGSTGTSTETYPLPYVFPSSSTASNSEIYASYIIGNIKVRSTFGLSGVGFRYVIIPGGVAGGRMASLKGMSYEEVKRMFNIPD